MSRLGGQYFAFVAEPQNGGSFVARQKPLTIGQTVGNDYEVQDGIKPGDKVIVSGTQFLLDGVPVIPHELRALGFRLSAWTSGLEPRLQFPDILRFEWMRNTQR